MGPKGLGNLAAHKGIDHLQAAISVPERGLHFQAFCLFFGEILPAPPLRDLRALLNGSTGWCLGWAGTDTNTGNPASAAAGPRARSTRQ
jgi:hypothetical protein